MEKATLQSFQMEVEKQCRFALMALQDLNQALNEVLKSKDAKDIKRKDIERIWYSIHAFLTASANISKLFWPPDSPHAERAELRQSLSVGDDSPLAKRTPRNYLEHFDNRLEKWAKSTKSHRYIDLSIGSLDEIKAKDPDADPGDFLRFFDYKKFAVYFRGDLYELQPIIESIQALCTKAEVEASKP